jgi:hypothetical protein
MSVSAATLRHRVLLLGRVLPRIHSDIARPTQVKGPTQAVTPKDAVVVRIPTLEFDDYLKRVGLPNRIHWNDKQ